MKPIIRVLAIVALTSVTGCGGTASVSGKVTYHGRPLTIGTIYVARPDGVQLPATIGTDGVYHFDALPSGTLKIGVISLKPAPAAFTVTKHATRRVQPPVAEAAGWFEIPGKYADPLKSGLTVDLHRGANDHNIELE